MDLRYHTCGEMLQQISSEPITHCSGCGEALSPDVISVDDPTQPRREEAAVSKHTPGSWIVSKGPKTGRLCVVQESPNGRWICGQLDADGDPQNEANARLIAEAPAMYHAINMLLGALNDDTGDVDFTQAIEDMREIFARIHEEQPS